jgi:hypothetical protein
MSLGMMFFFIFTERKSSPIYTCMLIIIATSFKKSITGITLALALTAAPKIGCIWGEDSWYWVQNVQ